MQKGSCLCSAISWSISQPPTAVTHCHCRMCRKQHGAAFATYARVERKTLVVDDPGEKLRRYASSDGAARSFCETCGASLFWQSKAEPDHVDVAVGTLDDPLAVPVTAHIFVGSKAEWVDIVDGLPCYERSIPDVPK